MTLSSRNIEEVYADWKEEGHVVIEAGDEPNYLLYGCGEDGTVLTEESSTEASSMFPQGLSINKNGGAAEGIFQGFFITHNYILGVRVLFWCPRVTISTRYWRFNHGYHDSRFYCRRRNPCSFESLEYAARYHQRALLGNALFSHINDGIFLGRNPSCPDGSFQFEGDEGSHAIEVAGLCLLDYPRRRDMHTT
jgi:hypothetical protein